MANKKLHWSDWITGLVAGTILGFVILGIGSRLGMRVIAIATNLSPGFSLGGSMTVVFLGTVTGTAMAFIFLLVRKVFPSRRFLRAAIFWVVCLALTVRGLRPVSVLNVSVFVPLILLQGAAFHLLWCRVLSVDGPIRRLFARWRIPVSLSSISFPHSLAGQPREAP